MADIGALLGATLGSLLGVNIFRLIAGVRFGHWRHVLAAYLAGAIALTYISAVGSATSWGPPDFSMAPYYWLGAGIAALLEMAWIKHRRGQEATQA